MSQEEERGEFSALLANDESRDKQIIRTSVIGIVANVALAGFKAVFGLLSNSIAIVLDAVNNLSDALSSIITIVGTRIANKRADREHPYGHGRAEYLTTIVIAVLVLWAGVTSLWESVQRIIHPEKASYEVTTLVVVAVAVVVKVVLGRYVKARGEALGSDSLVASGTDATMDAVISASTLVAAAVSFMGGPGLEAPLGAVISLVIIKSGYEILREAIGKVIGARVDSDITRSVKAAVTSVDGVLGAYDLVLNDYGPQRLQGSVHVTVDESATAREVDRITREVQMRVLDQTGVLIHTVGIYTSNSEDRGVLSEMRSYIEALTEESEHVKETHGLYVDEEDRLVRLDVVVSYDAENRDAIYREFVDKLRSRFPEYLFLTVLDADISD